MILPNDTSLSPTHYEERLKEIVSNTLPDATRCRREPGSDACSRCGSCCARVLPLYPSEVQAIKNYLSRHSKLYKRVLSLNKGISHKMCPFLDITHPDKKCSCMLYDSKVLPAICKCFTCNQEKQKAQISQMANKFLPLIWSNVDMWYTFFGKSTHDIDIAPAWVLNDLLKEYHYAAPDKYLMDPDSLPGYFQKFSWISFITDKLQLPLPPEMAFSEKAALSYLLFLNAMGHKKKI